MFRERQRNLPAQCNLGCSSFTANDYVPAAQLLLYGGMLKSLSEFQALSGSELTQIVEGGPILITDDEEPRFVAQSVEDFEAMVRRLRNLEQVSIRRSRLRVIPFRP